MNNSVNNNLHISVYFDLMKEYGDETLIKL